MGISLETFQINSDSTVNVRTQSPELNPFEHIWSHLIFKSQRENPDQRLNDLVAIAEE